MAYGMFGGDRLCWTRGGEVRMVQTRMAVSTRTAPDDRTAGLTDFCERFARVRGNSRRASGAQSFSRLRKRSIVPINGIASGQADGRELSRRSSCLATLAVQRCADLGS